MTLLYELLPRKMLPADYGGGGNSMDEIAGIFFHLLPKMLCNLNAYGIN